MTLYHGTNIDNLKILRPAKPINAKSVNNKEDIKGVYMTNNWYVALIAGLFSSLKKYSGSITWIYNNYKLYINMSKNLYNKFIKNKDTNIFIYRILKDKKFKKYNGYYISKNNVEIISKEIITYKSLLHIINESKFIKLKVL